MNIFKLIFLFIAASFAANAQTAFYKPFSFGAGYGVTVANAGEETLTSSNAAYFEFNYHVTPFSSITIDNQYGQLTGGDASKDTYGKQFTSYYFAVTVHADVQLGEFIDYSRSQFLNGLKNIHAGIGVGTIINSIADIKTVNPADSLTPLTYLTPTLNIMVPARIGYEFKIFNRYDEPTVRLDINYSLNTVFGTGLDGYTKSIYSKATEIKFYNYVSIGLKYSFGRSRSYRKQIYYSNF